MWIYLYSDQWSVPDHTMVPAHPGTIYDDVLVTGSVRGVVLSDGFEGGWPLAATSWGDTTSWTNNVEGSLQEVLGQEDPGLWRRDVIYLGSKAVAEIDAAGVHELHNDHLGSPRLITKGSGTWPSTENGTSEGTQAYGPYGELIQRTGYVPLTGYTSHIQTDASGLIYMRGRYYSPAWHAFVNSDHGVDPSTWNQRAYVGGSPFMATDPSGMGCTLYRLWNVTWRINPSGKKEETGRTLLDEWIACSGGGSGNGGSGGGNGGGTSPSSSSTTQPQTPQEKDPCIYWYGRSTGSNPKTGQEYTPRNHAFGVTGVNGGGFALITGGPGAGGRVEGGVYPVNSFGAGVTAGANGNTPFLIGTSNNGGSQFTMNGLQRLNNQFNSTIGQSQYNYLGPNSNTFAGWFSLMTGGSFPVGTESANKIDGWKQGNCPGK